MDCSSFLVERRAKGVKNSHQKHYGLVRMCRLESVQDFFYQVWHETVYASSGNNHFFTKSCHRQTYQNYEQSQQKLGTISENKVS